MSSKRVCIDNNYFSIQKLSSNLKAGRVQDLEALKKQVLSDLEETGACFPDDLTNSEICPQAATGLTKLTLDVAIRLCK